MMTVTVITVGSLKEGYLSDAVAEYKKRITSLAKIEEINLKEEKIPNEDDARAVASALDAEGERILRQAPRDAYKVALCVEGRQFDSVALAHMLEEGAKCSGKICLIIGSSHGLSQKVKHACDLSLSVSKLTFPHQLMRVMLYEILYRSFSILAGKKYHK